MVQFVAYRGGPSDGRLELTANFSLWPANIPQVVVSIHFQGHSRTRSKFTFPELCEIDFGEFCYSLCGVVVAN